MTIDVITAKLISTFGDRETERNWEKVDSLLKDLSQQVKDQPIKADELVANIRKCKEVFIGSLSTERTRLALTALDGLQKIADTLGPNYEPLQDYFFCPILRLCERTNRVIAERAKATLMLLMKQPWPLKPVMAHLLEAHGSQNRLLRLCVIEALLEIVKSCPRDVLTEFESTLAKILIDGLQDAAEGVRTVSKKLYLPLTSLFPSVAASVSAKCPPSILKNLPDISDSSRSESTKTKPSIKNFLQTKRAIINFEAKSTGPQRVMQKTFQAPSITAIPPTTNFKSSNHLAPSAPLSTGLPSRSAGPKLIPSISTGSLPLISSIAQKSIKMHSSSALSLPKPLTSLPTSSLPTIFPNYRRLVGDFKEKLSKSISWDARCTAIDGFCTILEDKTFQRDIVQSKASKIDLFDIYLAGLTDVHHRVVQSTLYYGQKLLAIISSERHPNPSVFVTNVIGKLFKILFDVQFKTRNQLLEAARDALNFLESWIGGSNQFFSCYVDFLLRDRPTSYVRLRKEVFDRLSELLVTGKVIFDDDLCRMAANTIRRLGTLLNDPDESIKDSVAGLITVLAKNSALTNWLGLVPQEYREIMETFIANNICISMEEGIEEPSSPTTIPIETQLTEITLPAQTKSVVDKFAIIVDEEISFIVRNSASISMPMTPVSGKTIQVVDFDTPRSMNHETLIPSEDEDENDDQEKEKEGIVYGNENSRSSHDDKVLIVVDSAAVQPATHLMDIEPIQGGTEAAIMTTASMENLGLY